jgi:hypothetical protein
MNHADEVPKTVILELLAIGDGLSGRAFCEQGPAREFSGRIGLMRAIDDLLDASAEEERPAPDGGRP